MAVISKFAQFYNTPEQLQILKNFIGERDGRKETVELDMNVRRTRNALLDETRGLLHKALGRILD